MAKKMVSFLLVACLASNLLYAKEKNMITSSEAILIVTFGTSVPKARKVFDNFDEIVKKKFPNKKIAWAYTSNIIRKKLAKEGIELPTVEKSLNTLAQEGARTIIVQSMHTIPGYEYHKIIKSVSRFKHDSIAKGIEIRIGKPLLSDYDDLVQTSKALLQNVPRERKSKDAVIFVGHGSHCHTSDLIYIALATVLKEMDKRAFLGTVSGHPTFDDILKWCKEADVTKAWLIPFMSIAGDHAINDMAGKEEDSWKSILKKNGIASKAVLTGTLENPEIRDIWLSHMQKAIEGKNEKRGHH